MSFDSFACAQTFYVDGDIVQNAISINISAVKLYFKSKPSPFGTVPQAGSVRGIATTGVTLFITDTIFGVPIINRNGQYTRATVAFDDIETSSDASIGTTFRFPSPVLIDTDKEYAFVVKFHSNGRYVLWKSVQGDLLLGTGAVSPGPSGQYVGKYYDATNLFASYDDPRYFLDDTEYKNNWNPLPDTDLKFDIYGSRFAIDGTHVSNTSLSVNSQIITVNPPGSGVQYTDGTFDIPSKKVEFITFDQSLSSKGLFVGGQMVYANSPYYPGFLANNSTYVSISTNSTNIIVANTNLPNGTAFAWSSVYNGYSGDKYIVIQDTSRVNIRKVVNIISNTSLQVDEPISFTNSAAKFMITAIGMLGAFDKTAPFGVRTSMMMLTESSANSTVRFVNNSIESVAVPTGGTGYSNSDVFYVKGFEHVANKVTGGYVAIGNLVTNSTGGITAVYLSNLGCGFVNSSAIVAVVANSTSVGNTTSNTSAGTGAAFTYSVGSTIYSELTQARFSNCSVINMPLSDVLPYFEIDLPAGSGFDLSLTAQYYQNTDANVLSGMVTYVNPNATNNAFFDLKMFQKNSLYTPNLITSFVSRSNEFVTLYSNGAANPFANATTYGSNSITFSLSVTSNNDFVAPSIASYPRAIFSKYIINNDYTNEHTDQGNSHSKGITTKINFTRLSEDIRLFLTAYKPSNTDIQVYARIHNSADPEPFDDKNWTRLELVDGIDIRSSTIDKSNFIELTYGFQQYPNSQFTLAGLATTTLDSSNVIGVGTTFSSNLAANDLIRIYSPLFPNNHYVAVVNSVTNATHLVLTSPITNASIVSSGMMVDRILYTQQGYNNIQNDNVVRYHNSSMVKFDGYDTLQIKIVLLSDLPNHIPRIDDIKLSGVSS